MRAITGARSERGSTIVMVAVSLAALLAVGALAVDMGMLLKVRNDAQRTADAAALAGAAAYLKQKPADAVDSAFSHAFEYAARNYVGGTYVDTSGINPPLGSPPDVTTNGTHLVRTSNEAVVVVIPDSEKVRVIVRRTTTGTFFGRLFNVQTVPVAAKAAAVAATANTSNLCIKPFALPDIWSESVEDLDPKNRLEDVGTDWNDPVEHWEYANNPGDYYRAYGDDRPQSVAKGNATGWGSSHRNDHWAADDPLQTKYWDDYGRQIKLKVTSPGSTPSPSFFMPWVIPGTGPGASYYRQNIWSCSTAEISLTQDYSDYSTDPELNEPGNMVGPTFQGMDSLIKQDSLACWKPLADENHSGYVRGEVRLNVNGSCDGAYPGWESSPRVITVPLFDPAQIQPGRTSLRFNNLGVFFIEAQTHRKDPVTARFLYFAKGTGEPAGGGPLIKKLRLVE